MCSWNWITRYFVFFSTDCLSVCPTVSSLSAPPQGHQTRSPIIDCNCCTLQCSIILISYQTHSNIPSLAPFIHSSIYPSVCCSLLSSQGVSKVGSAKWDINLLIRAQYLISIGGISNEQLLSLSPLATLSSKEMLVRGAFCDHSHNTSGTSSVMEIKIRDYTTTIAKHYFLRNILPSTMTSISPSCHPLPLIQEHPLVGTELHLILPQCVIQLLLLLTHSINDPQQMYLHGSPTTSHCLPFFLQSSWRHDWHCPHE